MSEESLQENENILQSWQSSVHVLTNPAAWKGAALSFGAGALVLGIIFSFITHSFKGLLLAGALFGGFMVLFILIAAVIDLCGGFHVHFIMNTLGLRSLSGKAAKAASSAAIVGGILSGNLASVGAGKLAESEQNVYIPYQEVTKVVIYARRRYIEVRGSLLQKPIGLYCNQSNFDDVLQILRKRCASAQFIE
ncbi:hypothetical protein [Macellibacteroides fermentans]|jgi:vacuolar-type H+-ATPase subunit I/STV1|uniref:hypothetical protein n=1 Tax=Macellibacteroides fermentans TaxID=879969 RepID=UPI002C628EE3|nr:hypothetical protein [Macellibacteroides fermentans]